MFPGKKQVPHFVRNDKVLERISPLFVNDKVEEGFTFIWGIPALRILLVACRCW